jgi:antitoxin component of RelBE/YafQ-DinJ toxin-antitoxin module
MKILKDNFIKFRVSEVEKQKYKRVSDELGLTVAGFVRWSANTQIRKYNNKSYEGESNN